MSRDRLTAEEARHLQRRLVFAAIPARTRLLTGLSAERALDSLVETDGVAPPLGAPPFDSAQWKNSALRTSGMSDAQYDAARAAQLAVAQEEIAELRRWWLARMIQGGALRENMALFLHGEFGSSSTAVDIPHALAGRLQLLRESSLQGFAPLLIDLITDPATLMQIGMDGHSVDRVSDRAAKLVLDNWTVGPGNYSAQDLDDLSRALTGWQLIGSSAVEWPRVDPAAPRAAQRTGLTPFFDAARFDSDSKTILGATGPFDARAALGILALHPLTARRFSERLLRYLGVQQPRPALLGALSQTYLATQGACIEMLRTTLDSEEFWSDATRWSSIKTPVQLAVGACRQVDVVAPTLAQLDRWLIACGQSLFDTPDGGESPWPEDAAWLAPADRLAVRYQLPIVLAGHSPALGLRAVDAAGRDSSIDVAPALRDLSAAQWLERLDPAPRVDAASLPRGGSEALVRIIAAPQYQLA